MTKCSVDCTCGRHTRSGNRVANSHPCATDCVCHRHKFGPDHSQWKGDDIGYQGAHLRIIKPRGKASDHKCIECEKAGDQWSYTGPSGGYSTDPDDYVPRCHSHHRKFDRIRRSPK